MLSNPALSLPVLPGPCKLSERPRSTAHPEATPGLLSESLSSAPRYVLGLPSSPASSVGPEDPQVRGWTAGKRERNKSSVYFTDLQYIIYEGCFTDH